MKPSVRSDYSSERFVSERTNERARAREGRGYLVLVAAGLDGRRPRGLVGDVVDDLVRGHGEWHGERLESGGARELMQWVVAMTARQRNNDHHDNGCCCIRSRNATRLLVFVDAVEYLLGGSAGLVGWLVKWLGGWLVLVRQHVHRNNWTQRGDTDTNDTGTCTRDRERQRQRARDAKREIERVVDHNTQQRARHDRVRERERQREGTPFMGPHCARSTRHQLDGRGATSATQR